MTSPQMARLDEHFQRLRLNTALPPRSQPGTEWFYSISVDVQGYLVEKLSGQPFDEFLLERIFEPLSMADTADGWVREPASSRGAGSRRPRSAPASVRELELAPLRRRVLAGGPEQHPHVEVDLEFGVQPDVAGDGPAFETPGGVGDGTDDAPPEAHAIHQTES